MIKTGDFAKVITKDQELSGIIMPNSNNKTLFLKLENGYNIGIDRKKIKKINVLNMEKKPMEKEKVEIKSKKNLPVISLLHTGGTISSRIDYSTGAVMPAITPKELIEMFPELQEIANIKSRLLSNIASEDLRFDDYKVIAKEIEKEIKSGVDGIIIGHGTDTMHYTSAALSFILEDLPIPVILVGAQRSSDRGSSDAFLNLLSATIFITKTDFSGIAICMHENLNDKNCLILPGLKTRKMHTSRRDAFKAINDDAIALVNPENKKVDFFKHYNKKDKSKKLKIYPDMEERVAIIRTHTNMSERQFEFYKDYKGLIIEGTGLGHIPGGKNNQKIVEVVKKLAKKIPVVMTSQCVFGRVNMNVYSPQKILLDSGVIPGNDMTSETAFIKLAWLLKNRKKEVKELMTENLKGEINQRLKERHYLEDEF